MDRKARARRFIWAGIGIIFVLICIAALRWSDTAAFVSRNEAAFKLAGYAFGPLFALLGFFLGILDKAEIGDLNEELGKSRAEAAAEQKAVTEVKTTVAEQLGKITLLERDLETIADSQRLWQIRKNDPFQNYKNWKADEVGAQIVTVALFKGGVGKSHLAANFAAYVSEKQQRPVLLVDLDYQGSLSTALLSAAAIEHPGSNVDALFAVDADLATVSAKAVHLSNKSPSVSLNGGRGLAKAWLLPSDYSLTGVESRLLVERVIKREAAAIDERYRLAHVLLNPSVRRAYTMIIIDTPPRMTLGTVNALVASHHYIVPTKLDRVSTEAVAPFFRQVELMKTDLDLRLGPAGIVGMMTRQAKPSETERGYLEKVAQTAHELLGLEDVVLPATLPSKTAVTNNDDLAYFLHDSNGPLSAQFYDPIFDELWTRIMNQPR